MAVAWTAVGVLGAFSLGVLALMVSILGRFDAVNARIDAISIRMDQSDAEHRAEIRALGDRIERRIDEHETRRHAG
ncbi:MAG: hypothetical protein ACRDH9_03760 [Actinomycetota bacterium]